MQFEIWYLKDLDSEFEDPDQEFLEAPSWNAALHIAEVRAIDKKKHLAQLSRLE